jgi:hypothetical protein
MCCCAVGDLSEDLAPSYITLLHQFAAQSSRIAVFTDTELMVSYHTNFRVRIIQAHQRLNDRIEEFHIFVSSKLAQVGAQAASLVLRNLHVHSTRALFEAALAKAIARQRRAQ